MKKEFLKVVSLVTLLFFISILPIGWAGGTEADGSYSGVEAGGYSELGETADGPDATSEDPAENPDSEELTDEDTDPAGDPEGPAERSIEPDPFLDEELTAPSADFDGYLVKLKPETQQQRMTALMSTDTDAAEQISDGLYLVDSLEQAENLAPASYIEYIEPNYYMQLFDGPPVSPPGDPLYSSQWNLPIIGFEAAWQESLSGEGVKIAVLDSGVVAGHEDVDYDLIEWYDVLDSNNTVLGDSIGHGSQVSGIITAQADNTLGLTGIASRAELLVVNVVQSNGQISVSDVIKALDWLLGLNEPPDNPAYGAPKCDIINMSFGQEAANPTSSFPALGEAVGRVAEAGVIMVAAAGNNGDIDGGGGNNVNNYPAAYDQVISVGALDSTKNILPSSTHRATVNLAAPGIAIHTIAYGGSNAYTSAASGTSMSAPIVTAAAALLKEKVPSLTSTELQDLLQETAEDLGTPGKDYYYGYGLIDLEKALEEINASYTIAFEPYWGTFPDVTVIPDTYHRFDDEIILPVPEFPGFTFDGWYEDANFTSPSAEKIFRSQGDKNFYAQWTLLDPAILDFTVLKVGEVPAQQQANDDEYLATLPYNASLPSAASLSIELNYGSHGAGYTLTEAAPFNGSEWTIDVDYGPASKTYALHVRLAAYSGGGGGGGDSAKPSQFTVTFDTQNGSVLQPVTVTAGNRLSAPPEPIRPGYLFAGWFIDAEGINAWNFGQDLVTKDTLLYAVWTTENDVPGKTEEPPPGEGPQQPGDAQSPPYSPEHLLDPYLSGYPDGTFAPDKGMTRAEISVIFWHLLGNVKPPQDDVSFADVFPGDWYYDAVMTMKNNRIIDGYPDNTYDPDKNATRAEFSAMISNFFHLGPASGDGQFPDVSADHWSAPYINSAAGQQWLSGFEDGLFYPDLDITRAQVASIMNRALNRPAISDIPPDAPYFSDLDRGHWAYYDIISATVRR